MQKREKILLAILPFGLIFALHMNGVFDSLFEGSPTPTAPKPQPVAATVSASQPKVAVQDGMSSEEQEELQKAISKEISIVERRGWRRDPFVTPKVQKKVAKKQKRVFVKPLPKWTLELVFYNGSEYVASISGKLDGKTVSKTVQQGDQLGTEKIVKIGEDYIRLRSKRGKRTFFLNSEDISFDVEESSEEDDDFFAE